MEHLFDRLFEASYDERLNNTVHSKEELREMAKDRIRNFSANIDAGLVNDKIIEGIRFSHNSMLYEPNATLSIDYATRGVINCVTYANIVISSMESMNLHGIINRIGAKISNNHAWLAYHGDEEDIELNSAFQETSKERPIESLVSATLLNTGFSLYVNGLFQEALDKANEALEIDDGLPLNWSNKAVYLEALGKYEEGMESAERAIKLDCGFDFPVLAKSLCLLGIGDYENAESLAKVGMTMPAVNGNDSRKYRSYVREKFEHAGKRL